MEFDVPFTFACPAFVGSGTGKVRGAGIAAFVLGVALFVFVATALTAAGALRLGPFSRGFGDKALDESIGLCSILDRSKGRQGSKFVSRSRRDEGLGDAIVRQQKQKQHKKANTGKTHTTQPPTNTSPI